MAFSDWSTTAANNATVLGVNIGEGCPAANMNNAVRAACADMRAAINPVMDAFLSSSSLSSARAALEIAAPTDPLSLTNLGNLSNSANSVPYMTGGDAWSKATATSFGRSTWAAGDAATFRTLIGALGGATGTFGSSTVLLTIPLGTGDTLMVQGGKGTLGGNNTSSVSFSPAFSTPPICIVNGGAGTGAEGDVRNTGSPTTSSQSIVNSSGDSATFQWVAFGKA